MVRAGVDVLIEVIVIQVKGEEDMLGSNKEEFMRLVSVREEESLCAFNIWALLCTDGETEGCGKRLMHPSGGVGGGDGSVHHGTSRAEDLQLTTSGNQKLTTKPWQRYPLMTLRSG